MLLLATVLTILWTLYGYPYGLAHQGALYARTVLTVNIALPLLLAALLWRNRSRPRYGRAFTYHWVLWAWISTYAFAHLGELP